ncbi:hypothetical protein [Micromonospora halophytica]|uniref:Uncharacterized protein n=1 Tax=Micromonospora halophytica TaxID=47864 RepID=A0A1C5J904_9ACTN|nr:hypothetical protein [Micromonospora halophytica]SCG66526.1 hypothetical protein GA0070560_12364 [Micromonospora halophytica]
MSVGGFKLLGPLRVPQAGKVRPFPQRSEDETGGTGRHPFAGVRIGVDQDRIVRGRNRSGQEGRDGTEGAGYVEGKAANDGHGTHPHHNPPDCPDNYRRDCRRVVVEDEDEAEPTVRGQKLLVVSYK